MNDHLFELLMNFFEKHLSQLTEKKAPQEGTHLEQEGSDIHASSAAICVRPAQRNTIRVFTADEQQKLTKASYQFISRMLAWDVIAPETMESIIDQLIFSESRYVTLEETKWTIRNTLATHLTSSQLAFLDLVLYQKEDNISKH